MPHALFAMLYAPCPLLHAILFNNPNFIENIDTRRFSVYKVTYLC